MDWAKLRRGCGGAGVCTACTALNDLGSIGKYRRTKHVCEPARVVLNKASDSTPHMRDQRCDVTTDSYDFGVFSVEMVERTSKGDF